MSRQVALEDWATQKPRLWQRIGDIQTGWRTMAVQYNSLPLAFRRDMSLGMWNERFTCAALLQHVHAVPTILSDSELFKRGSVPQTFDIALSEVERCPVSFGWYAMIHQAASLMRYWENVSDNDVDVERVHRLVKQAQDALQIARFMFQALSSSCPQDATEKPSRGMTTAWNKMCDSIKEGASVEEAGQVAAAAAPYVDESTARQNGAVRTWVQCEIQLPEQLRSIGPSS